MRHLYSPPLPYLVCLAGAILLGGCNTADSASTSSKSGPDLAFTSLSFSPSSPEAGDAVVVSAVIYNAGTTTSNATSYKYTFQGDTYYGAIPALTVGASTTITFTVQSLAAGSSAVAMTLDASDSVSESNEDNNSRSRTITWTAVAVGDLRISSTSVDDATLTIGDDATLDFTIAFAADDGVTDSQAVTWRIVRDDDSSLLASGTVTVTADGSASRSISFTDAMASGEQDYRLEIDYGDAVVEDNEGNNSSTFTIAWSAPG